MPVDSKFPIEPYEQLNNIYETGNKENITKAKRQGYEMTKNQLKKWNVKYHKLIFGKPSFDMFVDDKAFFFKKYWYKVVDKYLKKTF